ncbi:MAG TPA: hypothetical protein VL128_10235 [Candidatus Eisenbacteria bacterium]|nr:hypothetical protein [Candidatus Eisenbacteria bacterium]
MYASNQFQIPEQPGADIAAVPETNNARFATSAEVRAALTQLTLRPHGQRMVLCRLLRRAAAQASATISVVHPAVSHHTTPT